MIRILIIALLFIGTHSLYAQVKELTAEEVIADLTLANEEIITESIRDELFGYSLVPLNLNSVTAEQLSFFPFLTEEQITALIDHRIRKGDFLTLYELQTVATFDAITIQRLLPFVVIAPSEKAKGTLGELLKKSKHEVFGRIDATLQEKEGYQSIELDKLAASPNKRYLGSPIHHSVRYRLKAEERLQLGIIAEQDAGEPFFNKQFNKLGYDFYSIHLSATDIGKVRQIVIGDYRISLGQGVAMNGGYSLGKNVTAQHTGQVGTAIRPHYSANEVNFMRGGAMTLSLLGGNHTLFYSARKLDGVGDSVITSLKEDGYHRVPLDFTKKNNLLMQSYGIHSRYTFLWGEIGLTALRYHFDRPIIPRSQPYNLYYFRGNSNYNLSTDFRFHYKKLHLFGEAALSANNKGALVTSLQINLSSKCNLLTCYRYYDPAYQAFYANPLCESNAYNEQGILISCYYAPFYACRLVGYIDLVSHPWLRYRIDKPSKGVDYRTTADIQLNEGKLLQVDYRYRHKAENGIDKGEIQYYESHRLKTQITWQITPQWRSKTVTSVSWVARKRAGITHGSMAFQNIGFKSLDKRWQTEASIGYFNTPNYELRQYMYEYNGLYATTFNSYYGEGVRTMLSLRLAIGKRAVFWARYGFTHYFDRTKIGSGLETIYGNKKEDIGCYLCYKF